MIVIRSLSKSYDRKVIDDFNIEFQREKVSVILGPSGCGKTTLFNILSGLDKDYSGSVDIEGELSYIFQEDRLIPWLTLEENLRLVSDGSLEEILDIFHLRGRVAIRANDLSGGEKQRASIARAFLNKTPVILMDEALRSLDLSLKLKIIKELNESLEKNPKTMVVISHDIREALLMADDIVVLGRDPMKIRSIIKVGIPKRNRSLEDDSLLELERKLYTLMLED